MDRTSKFAMAFLTVFALPFAGFGLAALGTAIRQISDGTAQNSVWIMMLVGALFTCIGFGLIFVAIFGAKYLKRQQRLQAEHPAEPWLWREDWAKGRVKSNTKSGMIGAWIFAVFWNAVSAPMVVFLPKVAAKKPIAYVWFLFPLVGVFLLIRAIRMTIAYVEFGKTYFEMAPIPGVIGGELKGTIQARFPHSPDHGVQLRLTCVNRVTSGSGDSQSTIEHILWRGEASLSSAQLYPGPMGTSIPVSFRVPLDTKPSDNTNSSNTIAWMLEALADVPGVNYHDTFEVPVFRTKNTPVHETPETFASENPQPTRPINMTVVLNQTAQGVEFYFPAARNKSFASGTTAFLLIFGTVTAFLVGRAPIIFPLAFGFFTLILAYAVMQMWLGTTRIGIGGSALLVQDGYLGGGKVRRFEFAELGSINSRITAQQGGGNGTPFYSIELTLRSGKKVVLGRTIRNEQEVNWVVNEMRRLTGLQNKAAAAGKG
jgi:hypothetical protein